ncbi:hypothetical protein D9V32_08200 [Mycetocola tolaasinivorans]|uniref:YrhK domain-containing protein n=1 Tax=Mycetocola tolaasinivorans TaxID=76635 RepID=A0A3L7A7Q5_9MICO|nr:hypothetical protein [Mycetocola tolaasinivorans]RLP76125.1 hypothetical protein D9V32_08200 [Mycetocola tolaasinivorans]
MTQSSSQFSAATPRSIPFLVPTLSRQSVLFMIGSALFVLGSAINIWHLGNAAASNLACFIGAIFFTAAGLYQLVLSGDAVVRVDYAPGKMFRAEWVAAATQSFGTIMFNISTSAALQAKSVDAEKHLVWNPDAGGSVAFLISAVFVYVAYYRSRGTLWEPRRSGFWAAHINMIGCLAFAVSAVGSFVLNNGASKDSDLANWGTLIGAVCFFLASMISLPALGWNRRTAAADAR